VGIVFLERNGRSVTQVIRGIVKEPPKHELNQQILIEVETFGSRCFGENPAGAQRWCFALQFGWGVRAKKYLAVRKRRIKRLGGSTFRVRNAKVWIADARMNVCVFLADTISTVSRHTYP